MDGVKRGCLVAGKGKGVAREGIRGKATMTDTFREEQRLVEVMESVSMRMIKEKDWYELTENQRLTPPPVPQLYLACCTAAQGSNEAFMALCVFRVRASVLAC
uniref:Uncharacterized protein n=2 Tax=Populus TaxID=3689 RepID=A0A4U5QYH5_POPAL|nr:hypothetical protein D5086_0000025930 [Populus alba]